MFFVFSLTNYFIYLLFRTIDLHLEKMAEKFLSQEERSKFQRPKHITMCLSKSTTVQDFLKALNIENYKTFSFGIIGLHPCGDLGAILMRMFLKCPQAKFINFVGCCYMKLTSSEDCQENCGYPLSNYLRNELSSKFSALSYEAKEISCHAAGMHHLQYN